MKGYAGRESPPPNRLTVGPGQLSLVSAIEQMKIAQRFVETRGEVHGGLKMLRIDPAQFGVNFVTYDDEKFITSYAEIGALPADFLGQLQSKDLPVTYPAAPFLRVPYVAAIKGWPVMLIVQFADCLAYAPVLKKGAQLPVPRVGGIRIDKDHEELMQVIDIPSDLFKIVESKD